MNKSIKISFWICFTICIVLTFVLTILYFTQFNGELSEDIADWANFSSFIYGISTIVLTFLNVYLFYRLTSFANEVNSRSRETSTGIIEAYTTEEKKRSYAKTGVVLMQEYNDAHDRLMKQIPTGMNQRVNYTALSVAACQLEATYQILHQANEIFPTLQRYAHHSDYLEELHGIANLPDGYQLENNDLIIPTAEQLTYQHINAINNHHKTVVVYYKEVLDLIQTDLGAVYALTSQNEIITTNTKT